MSTRPAGTPESTTQQPNAGPIAILPPCPFIGATIFGEMDLSADATVQGIVTRPSSHGVGPTLDRLEALLKARGVTVFARIDHGAGAAQAGLSMPASQVLVFGNPRAGTPLMVAAPLAAIDLPFKALAWEDAAGRSWLSHEDPHHLATRFGLSDAQVQALAPLVALIEQAAG